MSNPRPATSSSFGSSSSSGEHKIDDAAADVDDNITDESSWATQLPVELLAQREWWEEKIKKLQATPLVPNTWNQEQKDASIAAVQSVLDRITLQLPSPPPAAVPEL